MRLTAYILARGQSKGAPGKNLAMVGGRPLICHSIEAALRAQFVEKVIVSTDSPEIASCARACGAEVPWLRPAELAQDESSSADALVHAIENSDHSGASAVLLLQPTSPLRTEADIDAAVRLFIDKGADSVASVTPVKGHPLWMKTIDSEGRMSPFLDAPIPGRRQDLPEIYVLNGALYLSDTMTFLKTRLLVRSTTLAYIMPTERSLDIDTHWDLHLADLIISNE